MDLLKLSFKLPLFFSKKILVGTLCITTSGFIYLIWKRSWTVEQKKKEHFSKVLFFPDVHPCSDFIFKPQGCMRRNCVGSHNKQSPFNQMISHILNVTKTIDLCMYSITCKELAQAVVKKHKQGVAVRIIFDATFISLKGSRLEDFAKAGIPFRHNSNRQTFMHNKFLVLDSEVVITGSANWTKSAVAGNDENVIITDIPKVVEPYIERFNYLWNLYNFEAKSY